MIKGKTFYELDEEEEEAAARLMLHMVHREMMRLGMDQLSKAQDYENWHHVSETVKASNGLIAALITSKTGLARHEFFYFLHETHIVASAFLAATQGYVVDEIFPYSKDGLVLVMFAAFCQAMCAMGNLDSVLDTFQDMAVSFEELRAIQDK